MMKVVSAAAVLAIASGASAAITYSTSFESPTWTGSAGGTAFSGQNGFASTSAGYGVVNNAANAHTGSQYVRVLANSVAASTGGSAWGYNFSAGAVLTPGIIEISGWVRIAGTLGTRGGFVGFDAYTSTTNRLGAISMNNDGSILVLNGVNNGSGGTASAQTGAGFISNVNAWHQLGLTLDFSTNTITYWVDGVALGAPAGFNTWDAGLTDFGSAALWSNRGASGTNGTSVEYRWDDLTISNTIPAPSALALAGIGGLVANRRRRA